MMSMRRAIIIFFGMIFSLSSLLQANGDETRLSIEELRAIQSKMNTAQSLSVKFKQAAYKNLRGKTSHSSGYAHFLKPNMFRWVLETPKSEQWIYNGKDLYNFFPSRKEAILYGGVASKAKEIGELVDMILNFDSLQKKYEFNSITQKNNEIFISLTPKTQSDMTKAELVFDRAANYIKEIKLYFRGQNHTLFTFSDPDTKLLQTTLFQLPNEVKVSQGF